MTEHEALSLVEQFLRTNSGQNLNTAQSVIFLETWAGRSYSQIAQQLGYKTDYVKQLGSKLWRDLSQVVGEEVTKKNVQAVFRRYLATQAIAPNRQQQDWGEAVDVQWFFGRQLELEILASWTKKNNGNQDCRLIGLFGLGGMGKTSLSVKLAQQVQSEFDYVIWRSLRQAPEADALISQILSVMGGSDADNSLNALMKQLHQQRCLLVLDNIESILQGGEASGQYHAGCEDYQSLLERIADEPHQSCVMITGREKPPGFSFREGTTLSVRSLQLQGLPVTDSQQLLINKGLSATDTEYQTLIQYVGGNPLALKIAATIVQNLFAGDVLAYLTSNPVFNDLWRLLDQQFQRLTRLQQQVMAWLAINRTAVMPDRLQAELLPPVGLRDLMAALQTLQERLLVESTQSGLTLQPVVMEYVTEQMIETVYHELTTEQLDWFRTHALVEAQTQDDLRAAQMQLIVQPLVNRLLSHFPTKVQLEQHLLQLVEGLRHQTAAQVGYAGGNLLNLFCYLKTNLQGYDLRFAHFQGGSSDCGPRRV